MEDILSMPDRDERIAEVTMDANGPDEQLSGFEVYFTDGMQFPFEATWRDPDEEGHSEPITVLDVADVDDRRGVLLQVERPTKKRRKLVAEQVWAQDES